MSILSQCNAVTSSSTRYTFGPVAKVCISLSCGSICFHLFISAPSCLMFQADAQQESGSSLALLVCLLLHVFSYGGFMPGFLKIVLHRLWPASSSSKM